MTMTPFQENLDTPLLRFGSPNGYSEWTLRNAVEGVNIFGNNGSGKTSGSGRTIALKYLRAGFGGLVLTAKADEAALWQSYCKDAGRLGDLLILEPGGNYGFDFLEYLSTHKDSGTANTENILETLKTVLRASEEKSSGKSDDPFWEKSLDMLLMHVLDLCTLAYGRISVNDLYEIVLSLPKAVTTAESGKADAFEKAFRIASDKVRAKVATWFLSLSAAEKERITDDDEAYDNVAMAAIPDVRIMKHLDLFFFETFKNLSSKTRSIVEFNFSGFLFRLLREPFYSMFCSGRIDVKPEDSLDGKIILLNIPVKLYHKIGRDCQILFKYIWQVAMEKRDVAANGRPVFLFADESQNFIHEHDVDFQATARSSRIATVYITQNLPNYLSAMGGTKAEHRIHSFLGTLGTKIFHANSDTETNRYASELIGDTLYLDPASTVTTAEKFSQSESLSLKIDKRVRPEEMVGLRTGGQRNNFTVEAYIHVQGDPLFGTENHKKANFNQQSINN